MLNVKEKNIELLSKYEPKDVLNYFANICNYPHPSENEKPLVSYLSSVLKPVCKELVVYPDGTIYGSIGPTIGCEKKASICLQAHCDMVCVKKQNSNHIFLKDPLELIVQNDLLKAKDTSLGADNGIGVAYILDIFTSKNISHGPLECLITTAEETTMLGVNNFKDGIIKSNLVINLDNESSDEICLGCCGGTEVHITNEFVREESKELTDYMTISINDGVSGHSGNAIRFKVINAIKCMFSLISLAKSNHKFALVDIKGGDFKNAIAGHCCATIAIDPHDYDSIKNIFFKSFELIKNEYVEREKMINIKFSKTKKDLLPLSLKDSNLIIDAYNAVVYGVISLNEQYKIADGSVNIGIINTDANHIKSDFLLRSLYSNSKKRILSSIVSAFYGTKFSYKIIDDYPQWTPIVGTNILQEKFIEIYKQKTGKNPICSVTEGGLELGVLSEKYPDLIMISMGPNIYNPHTFDEYTSIKSIAFSYEILKEVLKTI